MLIGSNNSLSYLMPNNFWYKIFRRFNKCQSKSIKKQYIYGGARFFDIKLDVDENSHITIKNQKFEYNAFSLYEAFDFLNDMGDAMVHISFDGDRTKSTECAYKGKEEKFIYFCKQIEFIYENIRFCGGERTSDGGILYTFKNATPNVCNPTNDYLIYKIASFLSPRWTKKLNEELLETYKGCDYILLNHVGVK